MSVGTSMDATNRAAIGETVGSRWRGLYTLSTLAAPVTVALILVAIVAQVAWPPADWSAGSASAWFARFQDNRLLGLLGLDLVIVITLVLGVPIFLGLYLALRDTGPSAMAFATALALLGTVFGKAIGYASIMAGILGLGNYLLTMGIFLSILSVVVIAVWNVMIPRGFFRLARFGRERAALASAP